MEKWLGSAMIIPLRSHGTREGMLHDEARYFVSSFLTGAKAMHKVISQSLSIENS
jgi:hypothetical protein